MDVLRVLARACGPSLVDVHADADHHRSVFTLAGPGSRDAADGARSLAAAVAEQCSIVDHVGEHPRFGALDVVPFVALGETEIERAQAAEEARAFAEWWAREFAVPVFLYDDADPGRRDLPSARSTSFREPRNPTSDLALRTPDSARRPSGRAGRSSRATACSRTATSSWPGGSRARYASGRAGCEACARWASTWPEPGTPRCR